MLARTWNGRTIRQRADGYLSLTDMAQACGKRYPDWSRLESTKSYLVTLSRSVQIPTDHLIEVNESSGSNESRGTWGHRRVAIRFAQWCSDEFAVQVDCWVEELLLTGKVDLRLDDDINEEEFSQYVGQKANIEKVIDIYDPKVQRTLHLMLQFCKIGMKWVADWIAQQMGIEHIVEASDNVRLTAVVQTEVRQCEKQGIEPSPVLTMVAAESRLPLGGG